MQFRNDIQGLRALAVIAVVLFHFGIKAVPGGFIGVDVFFVISGYLMTGIVVTALEKGSFSILGFYANRAKRIIPALLFVSVCLMGFGWFQLNPTDYRRMGVEVGSSVSFISNMVYAAQEGYFDAASDEKWMLHTWSLSVEWQFYLLYPILLFYSCTFFSLQRTRHFLFLAAVVSFSLGLFLTEKDATVAFYYLPTRAWEMIAGGLVFLHPLNVAPGIRSGLEKAGMGLIMISALFFSTELEWPGSYAIVPVAGAALVLLAGKADSLLSRNPVLKWIGTVSYSLYLWHWPIFVLLHYSGLEHESHWVMGGIIASVLMAGLSYHLVEERFRGARTVSPLVQIFRQAAASLAVALIASTIFLTKGVASSVRPMASSPQTMLVEKYRQLYADKVRNSFNEECSFYSSTSEASKSAIAAACTEAEGGRKQLFLWGDSHAQALHSGLVRAFSDEYDILSVTTSGCRISLKEPFSVLDNNCPLSNRYALQEIEKTRPDVVLMVMGSRHTETEFEELAVLFENYGVGKAILLGPVPQYSPSLPALIARQYFTDYSEAAAKNIPLLVRKELVSEHVWDTEAALLSRLSNLPLITYISSLDVFCNQQHCMATVPGSATLAALDYGHLSDEAAYYLAEQIKQRMSLEAAGSASVTTAL